MAKVKGTGGADWIHVSGDGNNPPTGNLYHEISTATDQDDTIDGGDGNDVIYAGGGNDKITGGLGDDVLNGGEGNDVLDGGMGTDVLHGGNGVNIASYVSALAGVIADLTNSGNNAGDALGDTYVEIAGLTGSNFSDTLTGDQASNIIDGGIGDDVIAGNDGADTLTGGEGSDTINGGAGGDDIDGGDGNDVINAGDGGDSVNGGSGNDVITGTGQSRFFGDSGNDTFVLSQFSFTPGSVTFDGGLGADTIKLGDSGFFLNGLQESIFVGATVTSIEEIDFNTSADSLAVFVAQQLGGGLSKTATIKGSAHRDGVVIIAPVAGAYDFSSVKFKYVNMTAGQDGVVFAANTASPGNFTIKGNNAGSLMQGAGGDDTLTSLDGQDVLQGQAGSDTLDFGKYFDATDSADGGDGVDTVKIQGSYAALTIGGTMLVNVENLVLGSGTYHIVLQDAAIAAGQNLHIDGHSLKAGNVLQIDASGETNGTVSVVSGAAADTIVGGHGADSIQGGLGADHLTPGAGADILVYAKVAESTGASFDTVTGFDFTADHFDVNAAVTVIDATVKNIAVSAATFDTDLATALTGKLGAHHAVLVQVSSGDETGKTFLVVDQGGGAGYQVGKDLVIALDSSAHISGLDATDFV